MYMNMANVYEEQGELQATKALFERRSSVYASVYGMEHEETADARSRPADVCEAIQAIQARA